MINNFQPNVANSIFEGFNDIESIMLCGYEWGYPKKDQKTDELGVSPVRNNVPHAFSNKIAEYGNVANYWRYDNRIMYWFELFGHKLNRTGNGGDFEKCILQTNWCNTQDNKVQGNYWNKLLANDQVENFIEHLAHFRPKLIFFFGSELIKILQSDKVLPKFKDIMGCQVSALQLKTKPFDKRAFKIGFQSFASCDIVCFPHPSSTRGLSDRYIELFASEVGLLIENYKKYKFDQ